MEGEYLGQRMLRAAGDRKYALTLLAAAAAVLAIGILVRSARTAKSARDTQKAASVDVAFFSAGQVR